MTASLQNQQPSPKGEERTNFGDREVPAHEKASLVHAVFKNVAPRYDLMNDVMSAGLHRLWKREMVAAINPRPGEEFLDVAGGTGDIARRILKALDKRAPHAAHHIDILDINAEMLAVGQSRSAKAGDQNRFNWICGDAEALPLADQSRDVYSIAFGIRNVTHIERALDEAFRVLKTGGRFFCLEFSQVTLPLLDKLYTKYSDNLIPWFGEKIADDAESYRYLVESIRRFPDADQFKAMMQAVGFENVRYRRMSGGIVALHSGWRL